MDGVREESSFVAPSSTIHKIERWWSEKKNLTTKVCVQNSVCWFFSISAAMLEDMVALCHL